MTGFRRIGEANTAAERQLEAEILRIPGWAERVPRYLPVDGGLTNVNWRVELSSPTAHYFVKVPGRGTEAFIDRITANQAATAAAAMGIAPQVAHFDASTGVEVHEFVEGYRACNSGDFKNLDRAVDVIGLYRAFNSAPLLPQTKTVFDQVDEHLGQVREFDVPLPAATPRLLAEYSAARQALLASGLDIVTAHNDPNPSNFLLRNDHAKMLLVDYDYASNNERAYELGVFIAEMFFTDTETQTLIEAYYDRMDPAAFARVSVCRALADLKWGLWGMVNSRITESDFDYYRFGVLKLTRSAQQMADPRWGEWLARL